MKGDANTEPNNALVQSPVNKSFDEIRRMPEDRFRRWAKSLREEVARLWRDEGAPPFFRFTTEEITTQFEALSRYDVADLLTRDDLEGQLDCILADSKLGSAFRAFFPNIAKTKDTSESREGDSLWSYFTEPRFFDTFLQKVRRHLRRDGFYAFSRPMTNQSFGMECFRREPLIKIDMSEPFTLKGYYAVQGQPNTLMLIERSGELYTISRPVPVLNGRDCIERSLKWLEDGVDYGWDFWLEPKTDEVRFRTRSSKERPFTVSKGEILQLQRKGTLPSRYLKGVEIEGKDTKTKRARLFSFEDVERSQQFQIRGGHYKGEKIFPKGFRTFKAGLVLGAVNFPPLVAKYLYRRFTEDVKDQDEIVLYDSSAGFGGRLLGALSAGTDRQLVYVGTDPNSENWLEGLGMSRYEVLARFYHHNVQQLHQTRCNFFSLCSEDMRWDRRFKKYRGKVDLFFTSPPYFRAESYSDDENQSDKKFPTYDQWRDGFLRPTLETAVEWLKPGRPLLWNIADTKDSGSYVPLEDDSVAILEELGMEYEAMLKFVLAHSPGAHRLDREGIPETKNFCMIKGRHRKYEPIFVFRKPL
jgi:hypothetical protein